MKMKEIPLVLRPREKAMKEGLHTLSDRELLALFIRQGTRQLSALQVADKILQMVGTISGLNRIDVDDLIRVPGISYIKATEILALVEVSKRMVKPEINKTIQIDRPHALVSWLNLEVGYKRQEYFIAVYLDKQNRLLSHSFLFKGTLDRSVVHPREIFKEAVKKSASSIILVHNHPSGGLTPSKSDIQTTEILVDAGHMMGVFIMDHLIVSEGDFVSIREKNPNLFIMK
ncbi:MAG: DNA repair protein RadC [Erysipelothrix sp.]|nr:DNA repair protein RadC [Erysipelothrix sp.]